MRRRPRRVDMRRALLLATVGTIAALVGSSSSALACGPYSYGVADCQAGTGLVGVNCIMWHCNTSGDCWIASTCTVMVYGTCRVGEHVYCAE